MVEDVFVMGDVCIRCKIVVGDYLGDIFILDWYFWDICVVEIV